MEKDVYSLFEKLDIKYELILHPALFKSTDTEHEMIDFKGAVCCKNLLLKDKKANKYFLVALQINKRADLKLIASKLNTSRLSFASDEELFENLGIKSGSASILNIILKPDTKVKFVIDKELLNFEKVCFHPNVNTTSISFSPKKIKEILIYYNSDYIFLDI